MPTDHVPVSPAHDPASDTIDVITSILQASSEHAIFVTDLEGMILLWNTGAQHLYGYKPEQMIGQEKIDILFSPKEQTLKRSLEVNALAVKQGKWEGLLNQQRQNGQIFPVRIVITPRLNRKGDVVGLLMIAQDISHEIALDEVKFEELKVSQFYTRSFIEANVDILIVTNTQGKITDINRQMCEVTGYDREEIIGSLFNKYFTDPQRAQKTIEIALAKNRVTNYELTLQSRQKKLIEFSCNATTFHGLQGQILGVLVTARDITERKAEDEIHSLLFEREQATRVTLEKANEQLQQVNRLQNDFLAVVSHEFRTTLTGIQGFSELLYNQECNAEEVKEYAGDINADAKRLNRIITDVLDLGQAQTGNIVLHLERVDLNALIEEIIDHMRVITPHHTFLLHLDASRPFPQGDRDKITQVMTNLLSNAVKYSPGGGAIQVTTLREEHDVHVIIQDQGMGIPESALEQIFVAYNRIDSEKTRYVQGTGLGLAIVSEIVRLHGGHLWAESVLGQGSQFHFTLPLV